jgi:PKD repeat protein
MKKLTSVIAAAIAVLPLAANAQSADLQAQIVALLQQVQVLQSQLAAQGGTTGSTVTTGSAAQGVTGLAQQAGVQVVDSSGCPQIGRTLKLDSSGSDVTRLQQFLARDRSIYPEGTVTGLYGPLTEAAVRRWQTKFNIVSSGSAETTGYGVVGPRTAAAISLQCSLYAGGSGGGTVGGYIQVSPISGNAPLTVNVQATVNTTNSCAGAIYTLNWGDNSPSQQIPVSAQNCNQLSQTYTHVYQYGGTYQVSLAAGSHRTTATVTVYGSSAPVGYGANINVIGQGTYYGYNGQQVVTQTQQQSGLPAETFSASPSSGNAPLTVTFSGIVSSADLGWCQGGCSDVLVFGDGTTATVPLPPNANSWQNYSLTHTYANPGTYTSVLYQGQVASGRTVNNVPITVTGNNTSYGAFSVTPSANNALSITASFGLPSACTGYDLSWGDGTSHVVQADTTGSCTVVSTNASFTHQYASAGSYSIQLKRGPTLSIIDTATVSITN